MLQNDGKTLNVEKTSICNSLYLVEITMQVAKTLLIFSLYHLSLDLGQMFLN